MSQPTLGHVRQALKTLPRGLKGLDDTYEQAMRRIECQDEGYRELAKQVLSWVTHAKRALSVAEVQHAVAVSAGMTEMDEEFLPEVEILDSVCAGLVTVNKNSDIIQLVHYTAQEYFERKSSFSNAETDITMACVTYLSFDTFATGSCPTSKEFEARLQLNPLYDYAARYWGRHARAATTEVGQLILGLLESEAKVAGASQAMRGPRKYSSRSQTAPRQMIGVHVAAYFGLREAMIALFENGYDLDARDAYGGTPLSWAAGNGHKAVVELLLAKEGIDPDSKDTRYGGTPLSWAAGNGHDTAVRLLLSKEGVDPDSRSTKYGWTPLLWAAKRGREAVVKLLLTKEGVDPDSKDTRYGRTPLSWAAGDGHEAVVKLLLTEKSVDPDSKDRDYGRTPLSWAAEKGHEAVVKLLLAKAGVDPDSKSKSGRTPLSCAAEKGHEAVTRLLLAKEGADPDSKSKSGRTPLSCAAEKGHETVTRLLLAKKGVDPDSKSKSGRTPLSCAAEKGHEAVVRLLLAKDGVDPDSMSKSGRTPLSWATEKGHEVVVRLLQSHGALSL
jgi:ankyrin repeat protein